MTQKILKNLEQIAKAAKSGNDKEALEAVKSARESIRALDGSVGVHGRVSLQELEKELSIWQSKLPIIWKETVGRQGLTKHATYWEEKLRSLRGTQ